jgi:hypothetical protein
MNKESSTTGKVTSEEFENVIQEGLAEGIEGAIGDLSQEELRIPVKKLGEPRREELGNRISGRVLKGTHDGQIEKAGERLGRDIAQA